MFRNLPDIPLKTSLDVLHIKNSCKIAEQTLLYLHPHIRPGISTRELDHLAEEYILRQRAVPALKGYKGFPGTLCASINQVAAHGIPDSVILKEGDVITLDVTVEKDGWYGDAAWTYLVGEGTADTRRLLKAAWQTTLAGVLAVQAGKRLGDIGYYIQKTARKFGCYVLEDFGGHGIGRAMHEDPLVPNFSYKGGGIRIIPGMVFTVEPMLTLGKPQAQIMEDGWTIRTCDNALTAQYEHTIAVFKDKIDILTFSQKINKKCIDYPPYF